MRPSHRRSSKPILQDGLTICRRNKASPTLILFSTSRLARLNARRHARCWLSSARALCKRAAASNSHASSLRHGREGTTDQASYCTLRHWMHRKVGVAEEHNERAAPCQARNLQGPYLLPLRICSVPATEYTSFAGLRNVTDRR